MTEVGIVMADGGRITATSQEISSGGMSLKGHHVPELASLVEVSFSLLTLPRVWVRANVTWKKPNKSFGVRFDSTDDRRHRLKEWIVAYLEASRNRSQLSALRVPLNLSDPPSTIPVVSSSPPF